MICSVDHELVKKLVKLRTSARARREFGELLLVGRKVVKEQKELLYVLVTGDPIPGVASKQVAPHVMKKITGLESPDGVAAVVKIPEWKLPKALKKLLVLDGVSDPGNMGTLLRTALALGWESVYLTGDCVDPYNDKAFRAARAAPLRFPVVKGSWEELDLLLVEKKLIKVVADLKGKSPSSFQGALALVLGNEGQGPSEDALRGAKKVTISMSPEMESLNVAVAGGILMHHLGGAS